MQWLQQKPESVIQLWQAAWICLFKKKSKEKEKAFQRSNFSVSVISLLNVQGIYTQRPQVSSVLSQNENKKQCLTAIPPKNETRMWKSAQDTSLFLHIIISNRSSLGK